MCWGLDSLFFLAITCSYVIVLRSRCMYLLQQIYMKSVCTPDKKHVRKYLYIHIYVNLPHICCCWRQQISIANHWHLPSPLRHLVANLTHGILKAGWRLQTSTWGEGKKSTFHHSKPRKSREKYPSLLNHISTSEVVYPPEKNQKKTARKTSSNLKNVPQGRLWHHGFDGLPDLMFFPGWLK